MATRGESLTPSHLALGRTAGFRGRPVLLASGGIAALVVALVLGVGFGSVSIDPADTVAILAHRLLGLDLGREWAPAAETIVMDLRLPRVLTAMLVGLALAVAGVTFQGLLRNPLADPYVLGTASGAALGAAIAVLIPVRFVILEFGLLHGLAFIGALVSVYTVYRLSRTSGLAPLTSLLLTGYAVGSLLAAGLAMAMYLSGAALRQIFTYLLGSFDAASWTRLAGALPIVAVATGAILLRTRSLNGLLLGEEAAANLGVNVPRERGILLGLASLATAAAVAISGLIGFVGLVVPHIVRRLVGGSHARVLPMSLLVGGAFLVLADLVARVVLAPAELPIGVVTAFVGAPFFAGLLWAGARRR
jgi:ABC-type Fe3+-siderophore transport system permease subunit